MLHLEAARGRPSTRSSAGNGDGAGDGVDLTKAMADEASFNHEGATRAGSLPASSGRSTAADPSVMAA